MNKRDKAVEEKIPQNVYYAKIKRCGYCIPVIDPKTKKPMVRKNARGDEVWDGETPRIVMKSKRMQCISDKASNPVSSEQVPVGSPEDLALAELAKDPSTKILTAEAFENSKNPAAAAAKKENAALQDELETVKRVTGDKIQELESQLDELTKAK